MKNVKMHKIKNNINFYPKTLIKVKQNNLFKKFTFRTCAPVYFEIIIKNTDVIIM